MGANRIGKPVTIEEQVECVARELTLRRRVYARRVNEKQMTQALADKEIGRMEAVLETLRAIEAKGKLL